MESPPRPESPASPPPPPAPARVMVIDDERDFLELAEEILSGHGFDIRTALDPEQALAKLEEAPADVLFVDLQMPKGGGRRLIREARTRHPETYAIVVTAFGSEAVAVEMLREIGAFDYITKTDFDEERAVGAVARALRARRTNAVIARRGFEIGEETANGMTTIAPVGYLTAQPRLQRIPLLAAAIDAARERGARAVLVDLGALAAAVPQALGLALCAARRLERAGGAVALYGATRAVAPTVELFDRATQGPRGILVFADRQAALDGLAKPGAAANAGARKPAAGAAPAHEPARAG